MGADVAIIARPSISRRLNFAAPYARRRGVNAAIASKAPVAASAGVMHQKAYRGINREMKCPSTASGAWCCSRGMMTGMTTYW